MYKDLLDGNAYIYPKNFLKNLQSKKDAGEELFSEVLEDFSNLKIQITDLPFSIDDIYHKKILNYQTNDVMNHNSIYPCLNELYSVTIGVNDTQLITKQINLKKAQYSAEKVFPEKKRFKISSSV